MFQRPKRFCSNARPQRTIQSRPDPDDLRKRRDTTQRATLHRVLRTSIRGRGRHRLFSKKHRTGYIDPLKFPEAVIGWDDYRLALLFQWFHDNPITGVVGIIERNPSGNPFIFQGIIRGGLLLHVYHKTHRAPIARLKSYRLTLPTTNFAYSVRAASTSGWRFARTSRVKTCSVDTPRLERRSSCAPQRPGLTEIRKRGTGNQATTGGTVTARPSWASTPESTD